MAVTGDQLSVRERDRFLRLTEIFRSLQGESSLTGLPTVFVRLTGCPLRCRWCDTAYAFQGGEQMRVDEVVSEVLAFRTRHVTVTGGEPLAQPAVRPLMRELCDAGCSVSLETSGAIPLDGVDERVKVVMDLKAPGSGEQARNHWDNLKLLKPGDEVKLVLADRSDYDWARRICEARGLFERPVEVLFSPVAGELDPVQLADWILEDGLPVRFQLQLHKLLWGDVPGH